MNAPSDTIDTHAVAESSVQWRDRFRALMIAAYGPDALAKPAPIAPTPAPSIASASDTKTSEFSAWEEAVRLGRTRERLRSAGLDASVRAIAKEASSSAGRVGDLLHIRDSFPDTDILMLGLRTMSSDSATQTDLDDLDAALRRQGESILKRLSFRALRGVSRLSDSFARRVEVVRLVAETHQP